MKLVFPTDGVLFREHRVECQMLMGALVAVVLDQQPLDISNL